jgi:hypothetical protein
MNCWRWAGVIFDGAEAFNVVGTIGIAAAGAAAAIAAIVYGALTSCVDQNIVIGLACWFLFESGLFVLSGVLALRKAKEATALRAEKARISTELHACRGRLASGPSSSAAVSDGEASDELDAVEALEANNRDLSAERVELDAAEWGMAKAPPGEASDELDAAEWVMAKAPPPARP